MLCWRWYDKEVEGQFGISLFAVIGINLNKLISHGEEFIPLSFKPTTLSVAAEIKWL